ncbi:MAG TPA: DUF4350 domain-containing protein [Gemmatimonadaceae bacterium]|nr:DUF4350 domain-containing protein [Gemmatimonadaceae bacterium]
MAERRIERWLRPVIVLPVLGALLVAAVIFSPGGFTSSLDMRLTTYSTTPFGARALYDVLGRLGWHVVRQRNAFRAPVDSTVTYLLLSPPYDPSATEVSALLDAVRRGATIVVSPDAGSALADSLRIRRTRFDEDLEVVQSDTADASDSASSFIAAAINAGGFSRYLRPVATSERDTAPVFPPDTTTLLRVRADSGRMRPAVMVRKLGKGAALVVADLAFARNDNVRDTTGMIVAVRLLERAGIDPGRRLVFDEYHQGFGDATSMSGVIGHALFGTPVGRAAVQALIAGLILLLAVGIRPVAPRERPSIERRSPLEHVGALRLAYEQIQATRLATNRLVRGLRRRHPLGAGSSTDDAYLSLLAQRVPVAAGDAALLQRALTTQMAPTDWVAVGGAIDHIERAITP